MSVFLIESDKYKARQHLTFFDETGGIKSKAEIKPELLKIPIIKNLVNKYGKYLAADILAVLNLYINKELFNQYTDKKRLNQCINIVDYKSPERRDNLKSVDILNCDYCQEIIKIFSVARLDAYESSFITLENVIKDTSEMLEFVRAKLALRREVVTKLEFENIEDPEINLKIQEVLALLNNDFKNVSDYSNNLVKFNKSIKDLKDKKVDNRQAVGDDVDTDPLAAIFDR
jgi:hypothetical protein